MAYILFVNPLTLSLNGVKGFPEALKIDQGAVFTATALASAAGCILMGLIAKYPIAIAPGMGLNAFLLSLSSSAWGFHGRPRFPAS